MKTEKPMRCLVLQLGKLGDNLQSLMALRAAKQLYPQIDFHYVTREAVSAPAKRVPWLSGVFTLPADELLDPILSGKKPELHGMGDIARWVGPMIQEPWDIVINWSYSEASSYLTGIIPSRVKLGYSRRNDTTFSCVDGWSHYIQAIVQAGIDQNIHMTDILTTQLLTALQIHAGDPADEGNSPVTSKAFFSLEIGERELTMGLRDLSRKWIGIQLKSDHSKGGHGWTAEQWSKLAGLILQRHPECSLVFLGEKAELPLSKKIIANLEDSNISTQRVLPLTGETDFDLWASVIGRCQWLLAGDTGSVHLASVLGTRVLNICSDSSRWTETGPYGNGHYVVSQTKAAEADVSALPPIVTPEAVYATWAYASSEWARRGQLTLEDHFSNLGWSEQLAQVDVHRSKIRNTNDGGGVLFEPMLQRSLKIETWASQAVGHIARAWYCGWVPPIGQEITREQVSPALVQMLRALDDSSEVLVKVCTEATRTANDLQTRSSRLRSDKIMRLTDRDELRDLGKKLLDLDQLIDRLAATHAPLKAFSSMLKVLMHNLRGEHLAELGRESAESYSQIGKGATILRDWIKHTLTLTRPKAILKSVPLSNESSPINLQETKGRDLIS